MKVKDRIKGFMLICPYLRFPNGFYKAYFRKFIVQLVTHVTVECSSRFSYRVKYILINEYIYKIDFVYVFSNITSIALKCYNQRFESLPVKKTLLKHRDES